MRYRGVIEGFYGPPWTDAERQQLFAWMAADGLDVYLYAPKDDLRHRAIWRESYPPEEAAALREVMEACHARGVRFVYGIGPGLDLRYDDPADRACLRARCAQVLELGADGIALLFDDIPDTIGAATLTRWGSLAAAQADVANELFTWVRRVRPDALAAFCPTPYCGRMAAAQLGGANYLETLGLSLREDVDVFWTGPDIVSREIDGAHVAGVTALLRRPPIIWDNLHANDYDSRRMYCGPYAGRPLALREHVRGILVNPNTEFPLNVIPLRTFGAYTQATDPWDPRAQYLDAAVDWAPSFDTVGGTIAHDDLTMLLDCFYLPYEDGPRAQALCHAARRALDRDDTGWHEAAAAFERDAGRLRDVCGQVATLRDRRLFAALHRRAWDLREELDLLLRAVQARRRAAEGPWTVHSDFHRPGTYRGGMIASLQQLLVARPDGGFQPAAAEETHA